MKISTNCSPLVIYFGFFFPDKTITLPKGRGRTGWGWLGGAGKWGNAWRTKYWEKGRASGQTSVQTRISVLLEQCVFFGGLPRMRTHPP